MIKSKFNSATNAADKIFNPPLAKLKIKKLIDNGAKTMIMKGTHLLNTSINPIKISKR
jgi:hypothetical protein